MDILLEERENQTIYFYCIASNDYRYDLAVIFSNQFFGKAMVMSLQTERFMLMCKEDIDKEEIWADKLGIHCTDTEQCKDFFRTILTNHHLAEQY
ncbi:MAG: DUF3055 domain-containing protein [Bacillaceae bacterium]|uniref:Protein dltD n=1 Tax=Aeribacillus pallidus TaxID=33936 RepID=A0A165Z1S5_9BACI|nr:MULTISPECIES: SAV0927 family protein [Aeribacillus]KZN97724.1 protein dltD precursor [Aeribacillus pallidus]MED1440293.1 DUF3055 family protein [Aeribacillus composti]REJ16942.1 MAG: DUF3055 domain-containing protein [Bacillaceae bacterium]